MSKSDEQMLKVVRDCIDDLAAVRGWDVPWLKCHDAIIVVREMLCSVAGVLGDKIEEGE